MYQDIITPLSNDSFSVLLDGTDMSTQIDLDNKDLNYIMPPPPMAHSQFNQSTNRSTRNMDLIQTQRTVINTNLPNSCDTINYQPYSFPTPPIYGTQQWGNNNDRFYEKQGATNTTHTADSTKHLGKVIKSNIKKKTPIIITPSNKGYSKKTPKPLMDTSLNKNCQTDLSFKNKHDTIESSRYSAIHTALSKLESMPKAEKNPNNASVYVLRNQKNRQIVLQGLNIDIAEINKAEAKRYYSINCARTYTIKENPSDSN